MDLHGMVWKCRFIYHWHSRSAEWGVSCSVGVQERFHNNPNRIFGLPDHEQAYTQVEVVVNRSFVFWKRGNYRSPISGKDVALRVNLHGQTVFLDGEFVAGRNGKDISAADKAGNGPHSFRIFDSACRTLRRSCQLEVDAGRRLSQNCHLPTRAGTRTAVTYARRPAPGFPWSP
ncbi:hypothetical protein BJY52DRAFT_156450 [Lactarius psammicola]|nr:hypothetical protein BJY52DRAFT_156450 [Lactarius psammicola]